ncbi:MAG: hypothetical protein ABSB70_07535 [Candidatus Velthaea sp.]|jgi:hypothetical protein
MTRWYHVTTLTCRTEGIPSLYAHPSDRGTHCGRGWLSVRLQLRSADRRVRTNSLTPAASGAAALTVPLPSSTDYGGHAVFPLAAVPAGLDFTVTYTNRAPAGVSALGAVRQPASVVRTPLDALSTDVVYACFTANYTVILNDAPNFTFVLPPDFATRLVAYNLALEQNGRWVGGYGGPGNVVTDGKSAQVLVSGRFGFTIPAGGTICVALYGRSISAPTPVPATPGPRPATPSPTPSPAPTPTASPTPGVPLPNPSSLTFNAVGAPYAQSFTVTETGYAGTWTQTNTCASIATVSTADHQHFTVTPAGAGACTISVTDTNSVSSSVSVGVTTSTIGVQ